MTDEDLMDAICLGVHAYDRTQTDANLPEQDKLIMVIADRIKVELNRDARANNEDILNAIRAGLYAYKCGQGVYIPAQATLVTCIAESVRNALNLVPQ